MAALYRRGYGRTEMLLAAFTSFIRHTMDWYAARQVRHNRRQLVAFTFDYIGNELNLSGVYEGDQLNLLFDWITAEAPSVLRGNAVDVGANIGNHSLFFSDHFPEIFSFEINPRTFRVLQLNAALASNVACFNIGLSNAAGEVYLSENPRNIGGTRIVASAAEATRTVPVATLDSFADKIGPVSVIKIDVEGHELQVLQGAAKTIQQHSPLVLFEQTQEDFESGSSPCIEVLKGYGYHLFLTIEDEAKAPVPMRGVRTEVLASLYRAVAGHGIRLRSRTTFDVAQYNLIVAVPPALEAAAQGL